MCCARFEQITPFPSRSSSEKVIAIDANIAFGRPVVLRTGLPIATIADLLHVLVASRAKPLK